MSPEQANLAEAATGIGLAGAGAYSANRVISGTVPTLQTVTINGEKVDGLIDNSTGNIRWVNENAGMGQAARMYNDSAPGARSSLETRSGLAPAIDRTMPDGTSRPVKFDGLDGNIMVDRKISVVTTQKAKDQALRQSEALTQNGLTGRWEVSNEAQAVRARKMLSELGISNITVKVVRIPGNG